VIRIAAAGARGRTVRAALGRLRVAGTAGGPLRPAGALTVADHGPLGCWLFGDVDVVGPLAELWAQAHGGSVRLYSVDACPDGDELLMKVRAVVIDATGARTPLTGATDDDRCPLDGDVAQAAHERLTIALELLEQLHHEDAELFTLPTL
jgi:hypothetical protein